MIEGALIPMRSVLILRGGDRPGDGKDHIIGFGYHSKSDRDPFGGTCYRGTGDIVCGSAERSRSMIKKHRSVFDG